MGCTGPGYLALVDIARDGSKIIHLSAGSLHSNAHVVRELNGFCLAGMAAPRGSQVWPKIAQDHSPLRADSAGI